MGRNIYNHRHTSNQRLVGRREALILLTIVLIGAAVWRLSSANTLNSPVPASIRGAVSFPVFYPDQRKLPPGYTLDSSSFRQAQAGVIIYSVLHKNNQRVSFSEQEQPAGSVIEDFTKKYMPIHVSMGTDLGQAEIGAYGKPPNMRTLASLPINHGPWLIATAPSSISQNDMKQIIQSLRR